MSHLISIISTNTVCIVGIIEASYFRPSVATIYVAPLLCVSVCEMCCTPLVLS